MKTKNHRDFIFYVLSLAIFEYSHMSQEIITLSGVLQYFLESCLKHLFKVSCLINVEAF